MSIDFRTLALGPIETNCYIIWDKDSKDAAIIDPGGDAGIIIDVARSLDLSISWVLLTHGHPDHYFSAGAIAGECGARIGMHESDLELFDAEGLDVASELYDIADYVEFSPSDLLKNGDIINLGNSEVRVLHTPGHSRGGLCFVTDAGIFCGDTVFARSVGRTDFPGGSFEQLMKSIREKLLVLDDSTVLYPGHGPATTIGVERRSNPFFR